MQKSHLQIASVTVCVMRAFCALPGAFRDVFCGLLHCDHGTEKLMLWREHLAYTMPDTPIKDEDGKRYDCKGAILDVGLDEQDPGLVPNGAKCGENMVGCTVVGSSLCIRRMHLAEINNQVAPGGKLTSQ